MSKLVFRKRSVVIAVLLCGFFIAGAFAQSSDQDQQSAPDAQNTQGSQNPQPGPPQNQQNPQYPQGGQTPPGQGGTYPGVPAGTAQGTAAAAQALAMRNFLQNRPEVMEQLKRLLVQRLRSEGSLVDEQTITDQMVYDRMQNDPVFRSEAIRSLVELGYISEDDAQTLLGTAGNAPMRAAPSTGPTTAYPPTERRYDDSALNPKTVPQPNPYPSLPSARDLYTQFPDQAKPLRRFGSDLFRPDVVGMNNFPMDLPAGADYVLGPGDTVTIDIWGGVSQRINRSVDREGRVSLPDTGPVVVAGMTLSQAQKVVQAALAPQYHDARVELSVTRLHTVRIYVVGDVQRPGAYDISSLSTPLNALYAAGGPTATGSLRIVKHYRGDRLISEMDLYDLLIGGKRNSIEHLEPGDSILVPPVGPLVAVSGMVKRPAIYELKGETQLSDVLQMAGGVSVAAELGEIKVERIDAHEKRVMLNVKLAPGAEQESQRAMIGPFAMQDGDRVSVMPILPYSDKTIYLQGHVYRPGTYAFKDGMKITDLIHSYQEILPEPSNHAEIIRMEPPDFRPQTIEVDLASALAGDESIPLQQFDTVWIFGRYEIDAPKVSIYGEVLRPGEYPMSTGMTAAALVKMAGGFRRGAYADTADLASYELQNGQQVVTNQQTVKIGAALGGDATADVRLKPGDTLTILQIPGWTDIGRSATVKGEVNFPGTYGINEGERLSSLIKRAGGFRKNAYPAGAVLERVEVRRLEEKGRQELIRRIEASTSNIQFSPTSSGSDQAAVLQAVQQQQTQTLNRLRSEPAAGRLVITISGDISEWENTAADINLRTDDVITIPRKPNFVLAYGQVYNPTAVTYAPGKTAEWYLQQAGGPTELAQKKAIYVIRANGSVVSGQGNGWFKGNVLNTRMLPGDVLVVPEKALGGNSAWKTALETAQLVASLAVAAGVAVHF
ncbi:MAG: SLBB domain-containing protein [Candidatus Korobacteraceae bacterium]